MNLPKGVGYIGRDNSSFQKYVIFGSANKAGLLATKNIASKVSLGFHRGNLSRPALVQALAWPRETAPRSVRLKVGTMALGWPNPGSEPATRSEGRRGRPAIGKLFDRSARFHLRAAERPFYKLVNERRLVRKRWLEP
jgi:hypothetical protein